jgi:protein-tyrosine phosphatase
MYRVRPWLYIGNYRETNNRVALSSYDIGAMLQLAEHVPQPGIFSLYVAVEDGQPLDGEKLRRGVAFVREHKTAGKKVLVACGAGISRSVTFSIAALKEEEGLGLVEAYAQIIEVHPGAMPHPLLWDSMCAYYHDGIPYVELWDEILKWRREKRS